jgi:polyvinyl alcohol dehydrogenase (cytochrome)
MRSRILIAFAVLSPLATAQAPAPDSGEALYTQNCAICHEHAVARAAPRSVLGALSVQSIQRTLDEGSMKFQAAVLSASQREAIAHYLSNVVAQEPSPGSGRCQASGRYVVSLDRPHWNGWGADLEQHRFQPAAQARLSAGEVPKLKLKWAFGFADAQTANAQPAVVNGRLFVGGANNKVYALDAASGCIHWAFDTEAAVRTAISAGAFHGTSAIFFGDQRATVYALNADSGALLWKAKVDPHPVAMITGAPALADEVVYVPVASLEDAYGADPKYGCCTFRGSVGAYSAMTGALLWKSSTVSEPLAQTSKNAQGVQLWGPAGAGVWSAPTVDRKLHRLYVTTSNATSDPAASTSDAIVAFDLRDGKLLWSYQATANDGYNLACDLPAPYNTNCPSGKGPDFDFASSATLIDMGNGHRALLAGQKSGVVHAIDPDAGGKLLWQTRVGQGGRMGGVQWGPATDGELIYVALSDVQVGVVPAGTAGAQGALGANFLFNPKIGGGLFALDVRTGAVRWSTPHPGCLDRPGCSPAQSAAVTAIPGVVFSGSFDGHLRAYASDTGRIIWDVDTWSAYATVNGVAAHGGSINGPGAVVVNGMLYVNSGYAYIGTAPGNVLLAYSVEGR